MAIDFDALFSQSLSQYAAQIEKMSEQQVEEFAERLYDIWLETPNTKLLDMTPAEYFREYTAQNLCEAVLEYAREHKRLPDPLSYEIMDRRGETERILTDILKEARPGREAIAVIALLTEMQSSAAIPLFIQMVCDPDEDSETADAAAEAVIAIGRNGAELAMQMLPMAETDAIEDRLADIVCNGGYSEAAFDRIVEIYHRRRDQRAFYAACLAKLFDERALDILREGIADPMLTYYEYLAMRDAIEALGGEVHIDREFTGDSDYEFMKEYEEEDEEGK